MSLPKTWPTLDIRSWDLVFFCFDRLQKLSQCRFYLAFYILILSSFDKASLFFLMALGSFTFTLNLLGLISIPQYSPKFFTVTTRYFNVAVVILQFPKYAAYLLRRSYGSSSPCLILMIRSSIV